MRAWLLSCIDRGRRGSASCLVTGLAMGLLLACTVAWPARAHQPSTAYLRLDLQSQSVRLQWDIALRDLDLVLDLDADGNGSIDWGEVRGRHAPIQALAYRSLALRTDAGDCRFGPAALAVERHGEAAYAALRFDAQCPAAAALQVHYRLLADVDPSHRGIARISHGQTAFSTLALDPRGTAAHIAWSAAAMPRWTATLIGDGVHHILIGWDHVLFLLCLLLPAVLWRTEPDGRWQAAAAWRPVFLRILAAVTAFTAAHTTTLGLAAFGIVQPPARLVETAIALTVGLAALHNLVPRLRPERLTAAAFAFGLVHGFGFANVLQELDLPRERFTWALLQFNLGVELGQLTIVSAALCILYPLRHARFYVPAILRGGSAAALAMAAIWTIERLWDIRILSIGDSA